MNYMCRNQYIAGVAQCILVIDNVNMEDICESPRHSLHSETLIWT